MNNKSTLKILLDVINSAKMFTLRCETFDIFGKQISSAVKAIDKRNARTPIAVPYPQAPEPL